MKAFSSITSGRRSSSGCRSLTVAVTGLIVSFLGGCAHRASQGLERVSYSQPQMGIPFDLTFYAPPQADTDATAEKVYARIKDLNEILSDYETESELNRLSRTAGSGTWVPVSQELWFVLKKSQEFSERSDGAFDVTVGPLSFLWRKARREKRFPQSHHLDAARELVGYKNMKLDPKGFRVQLTKPAMKLDLGGIAKGYAADVAISLLRQEGYSRALVAAAGDLVASDPPPGKKGWLIALENQPANDFIWLKNGAVSTSGDLFQHLEIGGVRYSHIVDPRTGVGLTNRSLVNVVAGSGLVSDALATAASVLTPDQGLALLKRYQVEGRIIVQEPKHLLMTPGFNRRLLPQKPKTLNRAHDTLPPGSH